MADLVEGFPFSDFFNDKNEYIECMIAIPRLKMLDPTLHGEHALKWGQAHVGPILGSGTPSLPWRLSLPFCKVQTPP